MCAAGIRLVPTFPLGGRDVRSSIDVLQFNHASDKDPLVNDEEVLSRVTEFLGLHGSPERVGGYDRWLCPKRDTNGP